MHPPSTVFAFFFGSMFNMLYSTHEEIVKRSEGACTHAYVDARAHACERIHAQSNTHTRACTHTGNRLTRLLSKFAPKDSEESDEADNQEVGTEAEKKKDA